MFHFLQKKMLKKIRNKGTINVLQGGGGSAEYGQRPYFYKKNFLDPSLILSGRSNVPREWTLVGRLNAPPECSPSDRLNILLNCF